VVLLLWLVSARPGSILVVDASSERLRAMVAVLRHAFGPASVRGTTDPEDAAAWIACERPAVLVTPADTANGSGAVVVEELRGRWGPVPVVLTHGPEFKALSPPVVHLPAPVDPVRLRSEVGRWVPCAGAGSIATTLLSDVLALYARAGRTGVLDVRGPARTGSVWFEDGELVHAACGAHTGATALFEVLCWNEGRFAFRCALPPTARSLSGSLPELLARADAVP
jgi:CheY-like chemotaxis protein